MQRLRSPAAQSVTAAARCHHRRLPPPLPAGFRAPRLQLHSPLLSRSMTAEASRLAKRHRLGQAAVSDGAPQQMAAPAPAAVAEAEAVAAAAPSNAQPAKKAKQVVMPTPVPPPAIPADPAAWDNAVLLVDKPKVRATGSHCSGALYTRKLLSRQASRPAWCPHQQEHTRAASSAVNPAALPPLSTCPGLDQLRRVRQAARHAGGAAAQEEPRGQGGARRCAHRGSQRARRVGCERVAGCLLPAHR